MFPQSNANRPVGSTPKPSRKSPSPWAASPIPSIWPNAIRLTSPSSVSRRANRIAPIIPMGPNPSFIWLFRDGEEYAARMAHPKLLPETPSSLGSGRPHQLSNNGTEDFAYYVIADNPRHDSCYYPDSGKWAVNKESLDYIIVQGNETDYYKDRNTADDRR